ncbi:multicopper oxidase family protein [Geobacter pickeringii]|uniref:multicopper oxidase family protein n=1 Tax=Geobacter pickeringii TaxID=345632 RepID=UPI00068CBB53|nr:multicopper oxidase domain-containing protein [Geobacter pickeringii]
MGVYRRMVSGGLALVAAVSLSACSGSDKTVVIQAASRTEILNPLDLQQFGTPLPMIPVAAPDTVSQPGSDFYTVVAEQTANYDFGLRRKDGSEIVNPATGAPIRTTVWGYRTNGVKAGYLGATVEARSTLPGETGRPVMVKYINDLRDSAGNLLTRHLLTVDPTLHGADMGAPEIRIVTHLHGGHVVPESDGHPEAWITNDPNAKTGLPADPVSGRPARPDGNTVTYTYENTQKAEQLWYHDHAMGITRLNVYAGLAANYLVRDSVEDALNLPRGNYEMPLVIQDKSFNQDGSLHYEATPLINAGSGNQQTDASGKPVLTSKPEFFGNVITVNGKAWPYLDVEPRKYRFRMLNGSDSRFYNIWLEARDAGGAAVAIPAGTITQIGNDGGLLPASVAIGDSAGNALLLSLAERADVIVDFSKLPAGTSITMRNNAPTPFPGGDPVAAATTGRIMQFRISKPLNGADTSAVPANPRPVTPLGVASNVRYVDLQETMESGVLVYDPNTGTTLQRLKILLNGLTFDAPITEKPRLNVVEEWVIINNTVDMHPMHLHLVDFEVVEKGSIAPGAYTPANGLGGMPVVAAGGLRRNAEPGLNPVADSASADSPYRVQPHEMGEKDTVRVPPANDLIGSQGYVRIRAKFDKLGTYMWHCHILSHEDHEMMRPFTVVP